MYSLNAKDKITRAIYILVLLVLGAVQVQARAPAKPGLPQADTFFCRDQKPAHYVENDLLSTTLRESNPREHNTIIGLVIGVATSSLQAVGEVVEDATYKGQLKDDRRDYLSVVADYCEIKKNQNKMKLSSSQERTYWLACIFTVDSFFEFRSRISRADSYYSYFKYQASPLLSVPTGGTPEEPNYEKLPFGPERIPFQLANYDYSNLQFDLRTREAERRNNHEVPVTEKPELVNDYFYYRLKRFMFVDPQFASGEKCLLAPMFVNHTNQYQIAHLPTESGPANIDAAIDVFYEFLAEANFSLPTKHHHRWSASDIDFESNEH